MLHVMTFHPLVVMIDGSISMKLQSLPFLQFLLIYAFLVPDGGTEGDNILLDMFQVF